MKKILLDTDIGCDIDDCFALTYLLCRKDVELMGITTTTGLCHLRAQLADKICTVAGKSIPVHVGSELPLSGQLRQSRLTQTQTAVAHSNDRKYTNENTAIEFMRNTIEAHPGEITLLCIGPLTNPALLFRKYPHIPALLGGMVIIGGRYGGGESFDTKKWGFTEWNIICDTEAAETVFCQRVSNCIVIGVDQTCRFHISPAPIKEALARIAPLKAAADSINIVVDQVYFHDAIAIYGWLHPETVTMQKGNVQMNLADPDYPSATPFYPNKNGRHLLITDFSPKLFAQNYAHTVGLDFEIFKEGL